MRTLKKIILGSICSVYIFGGAAIPAVAADQSIIQSAEKQTSHAEFEELVMLIFRCKKINPELDARTFTEMLEQKVMTDCSKDTKGIVDVWNALNDAEKKLVIRYPFDALKVNDAKNIAALQTVNKFGYSGLGDRSDAFRHGIWNAEMTVLIGRTKAELFATAHEETDTSGTESDGFLKTAHKEMDLHNNAVGREIGYSNPDVNEEQMADLVYMEVSKENSGFIWLHE